MYGFAGAGATDGSVDLFWSAYAVGAAGFGSSCRSGESTRGRRQCSRGRGMTKDAGTVTATAVFALIGVRWLLASGAVQEPRKGASRDDGARRSSRVRGRGGGGAVVADRGDRQASDSDDDLSGRVPGRFRAVQTPLGTT